MVVSDVSVFLLPVALEDSTNSFRRLSMSLHLIASARYIKVNRNQPQIMSALHLIPWSVIKRYGILPLEEKEGKLVVVIPKESFDKDFLDRIRFRLNQDPEFMLDTKRAISGFIKCIPKSVRARLARADKKAHAELTKSVRRNSPGYQE